MAIDVLLVFLMFNIIHLQHVSGSQVCDTQVLELQVKKEQRRLEFPGNQNVTNNVYHCQWRLTTEDEEYTIVVMMESVFISHKANCSISSLTVYDGRDPTDFLLRQECSNRTEPMVVNSSNENVYIVWRVPTGMATSDTFTLWYSALENGGKTHNFTKTTYAGVIAGVILFVIFTSSIIMAIICCCRNRAAMGRLNIPTGDSMRRYSIN